MSTFSIKAGDLVPALTATLLQNSSAIDLTTATSVKFAMKNRATGTTKVDAAATVITPAAGTVKYTWTGTDTDTAGNFDAEWQITWPTGKQTIPGRGFDTIAITGDIAT